MQRRNFLKNISAGAIAPSMLGGLGMGMQSTSPWQKMIQNFLVETDHVLVMVRLDGGNDGLNTVIPLDQYDKLANVREKVIIPRNQILDLDGHPTVGFHPSMTEMRNLFNEGKLSVIQSVGYPNPDYSHFRSTDIWMTGADSDEILSSGWMGRYMNYEYPNFPNGFPNADVPDPLSVELGGTLSLTFQGPFAGMGMSITNPNEFYNLVQGIQSAAPNTPAGKQLEYVRRIAHQSNEYGEVLLEAYNRGTNMGTYEDKGLSEQLKIVARLISGGIKTRVFMVSLGGFDTHDNQVIEGNHTAGEHARLLSQVSKGISSFMNDIEQQGFADRVTGMTFSEFGRRVISNFSNGTDHGSAAPMFVFGTQVKPGILGTNPIIPLDADEDTNLPMQYDFRSVYSTLIKDWFCVPQNDLEGIMLQDFQYLPLIDSSDCISTSTHELNQRAGENLISASPSPFTSSTNIKFETAGGRTLVQVFNTSGQLVATPIKGTYQKGTHEFYWNSENLPAGTYYLRLQNGVFQQVKPIVKVR